MKASLHDAYLFQALIKGLHIRDYLFNSSPSPFPRNTYGIDLTTASFHQTLRTWGLSVIITCAARPENHSSKSEDTASFHFTLSYVTCDHARLPTAVRMLLDDCIVHPECPLQGTGK